MQRTTETNHKKSPVEVEPCTQNFTDNLTPYHCERFSEISLPPASKQRRAVDSEAGQDLMLLFRRALLGDQGALLAVIDKARPLVRSAAARVLSNTDDVEEACQDALIAIHERLDQFRGSTAAALRGWIYKIAINSAFDIGRKLRNESSIDSPQISQAFLASSKPMEQMLSGAVINRDFARALEVLTKSHVTVLLLRAESYSYDEIANMLEVPVGTVRSRLHDARRSLKTELRERGLIG